MDSFFSIQPTQGIVAAQLREALPNTPLLLKVGHINNRETAHALVEVVAPSADALVMVNGLSAKVRQRNAELLFEGQCRGIAGRGDPRDDARAAGFV